jgi:diguanylate cyclase (GGDEF)-like protein/PAS domain S-box-containing protein
MEVQYLEKKIEEQCRFLSVTLNSIGDGMIVTDKEGRVKRLNTIAEELTGWRIDEAKAKDIREIFNIVNSKTGKKLKTPIEKILKHGRIEGLGNHTKLIAKDGKEYHIEDSAAPIKTGDGKIQGTVIIFRDLTKKHKIRKKIKKRENILSRALNKSPFPIMVCAEDGEVITVNNVWTEITGYTKEEIPTVKDWIKKAYPDKISKIENEDGRKLFISTAVDITPLKNAENELQKINKIYRTLSLINQLIVRENSLNNLLDEAAKITFETGKYKNIWIGKVDFELEKINILSTAGEQCPYIKEGEENRLDIESEVPDLKVKLLNENKDHLILGQCQKKSELDPQRESTCSSRAIFALKVFGKIWGIFSFCSEEKNRFDEREIKLLDELTADVSLGIEKIINEKMRQNSEIKLKESEKKYRRLFEKAPVGIFTTTSDGKVEMFNPHMAKILGFDSIAAAITYYNNLGQKLYLKTKKRDQFINQIKEEGMVSDFVFQAYDKEHNILWLEMNARINRHNQDGTFVIDGFCSDITERRQSQEKIQYLGFHDKLTGLYNRAFLEEEIDRIDTKRQLPISIIMGDLNNLKLINDTYGHQTGDILIKKTAEMLEDSCRYEDIIARWGGDEFVVLLPQTTVKESEVIIKRINQQIKKEKGELAVSISLGTASKLEKDEDLMAVLSQAEDRMYKNKIENKKSVRNRVLSAFLTTLKEKSSETEEHVNRMSKMAKNFGEKVGLSNSEQDRLYLLIQMHDIGKIAVSEKILNKPDKLNKKEWEIIKKHTETGFRITSNLEEYAHISHEVLHHHEHWDGSGYPEKIAAEDIPLLSRMLTIIDSYDVMLSGRPYKAAMTRKEADAELNRCAGSQFDPDLVEKFIENLSDNK